MNEGVGPHVAEVARGNGRFSMGWGPQSSIGTGLNAPVWMYDDKVLGLRVQHTDCQLIRMVNPALSLTNLPEPISFRRGITIEFFGRSLIVGTTGVNFSIIQIGTFQAGNVAQISIGAGQNGYPCFRCYYYGTEVVHTPFTTPANLIYPNHQSLPNHVIFTASPGGEACIYGEGRLVTRMQTPVAPFSGDELAMFVNLAWDTNFVGLAPFEGVLYKYSIYPYAMGPASAYLLATNPMRVLYPSRMPAKFQPMDTGGDQPPISGGPDFVLCDQV
jgi:hypothetical protein